MEDKQQPRRREPSTALLIFGVIVIIGLLIAISVKNHRPETIKKITSDIQPIQTIYRNDPSTQNEIRALTDKVNELQNSKQNPALERSTADIIAEWKDRVPQIMCKWTYADGTLYQISTGSGNLLDLGYGTTVFTNKHVIQSDAGYFPAGCKVYTWDSGYFREVTVQAGSYSPFDYNPTLDLAQIRLDTIATAEKNKIGMFHQDKSQTFCSSANLGDKLVILGYPAIGTDKGITVTEGIISGIEPDYYVTDAKIDHGNSGGAAILLKDDCWLGIPSSSVVGEIESMGRILKSSSIFKK